MEEACDGDHGSTLSAELALELALELLPTAAGHAGAAGWPAIASGCDDDDDDDDDDDNDGDSSGDEGSSPPGTATATAAAAVAAGIFAALLGLVLVLVAPQPLHPWRGAGGMPGGSMLHALGRHTRQTAPRAAQASSCFSRGVL